MRAVLTGIALAVSVGTCVGQTAYPQRQVTLVIPTTVGTAADITARNFAPKLAQKFGRPFVVDNRTGASGNIAVSNVVKAPPDGYTILVTASTLAVSPFLSKGVDWDPVKDLQPVAILSAITYVLLVHPSQPIHSVKELVAAAKQNPGKLNYSSPGTGTPHHLIMEMFKLATGTNITHIPYKGTAPAMTDVMNGQVDYMVETVAATVGHVRSGRLKALGVSTLKPAAAMPDVPTLAQAAGLPDYDAAAWIGYAAPAGTPREVLVRLSAEIQKALQSGDLKDRMVNIGLDPVSSTPDEMAAFMRREQERYAAIIKAANIRLE